MQQDYLKHSMQYGFFLGVVFSLNFILGLVDLGWFGFIKMAITFAIPYILYRFTVDCRDRVLEGEISFIKAYLYGIRLFFFASLVAAAVKYIYFQFIDTAYLSKLFNDTMLLAETLKIDSSILDPKQLKALLTPINVTMQIIWVNIILGSFISIFTALAAKRNASSEI